MASASTSAKARSSQRKTRSSGRDPGAKDKNGESSGIKKPKATARKGAKAAPVETVSSPPPEEKKSRTVTVDWKKPAFHRLTDKLLTIIEGNNTYKEGFGFQKSSDGSTGPHKANSSGGRNKAELHRKIAQSLFMDDVEEKGQWDTCDPKLLAESVRNRINFLRKTYNHHRKDLSSTGQGLLSEDREDEITPGSDLANIWDQIQKKFPWFKRMHKQGGNSPIVDRSAVADSTTPLSLDVLGGRDSAQNDKNDSPNAADEGAGSASSDRRGRTRTRKESCAYSDRSYGLSRSRGRSRSRSPVRPISWSRSRSRSRDRASDREQGDNPSDADTSNSHAGSPGLDDDKQDHSPPPVPKSTKGSQTAGKGKSYATSRPSAFSTPSCEHGRSSLKRRAAPGDQITDKLSKVARIERETRIQVANVHAEEKTNRALAVEKIRVKAMKESQEAARAAAREDAEAAHRRQLEILKLQLEIARVTAGQPSAHASALGDSSVVQESQLMPTFQDFGIPDGLPSSFTATSDLYLPPPSL